MITATPFPLPGFPYRATSLGIPLSVGIRITGTAFSTTVRSPASVIGVFFLYSVFIERLIALGVRDL